jgi:glycosyltransferase involved in cell wall biosynthesis
MAHHVQSDTNPLVSVVIPTHNSGRFIVQALEGVLAQTYPHHEVIVVDDGSTDDTAELLRPFADRIRYHQQPNRGPSAARNAGIALATGALVCFLDADDGWLPDKLALQVAFMAAHREVGLAFADAEEWEGTEVRKPSLVSSAIYASDVLSQTPLNDAFRKLVMENFIPTSTVMVRKECFADAGVFDETLVSVEDRDLWLRVAGRWPIACLPRVVARKRRHDANISGNAEVALRSRLKVWNKARQQFPTLAPALVYHALLARTYQQLGYVALGRGEMAVARESGVAAIKHGIRGRSSGVAGSVGLFLISLLPWPMIRAAWRTKNRLSGKEFSPATTASLR